MMANPVGESWFLEVVRGADVGRRFALEQGETVLGNAPEGKKSINLADQEGTAPRRMAARQAKLDWRNGNLVVADLESPGGTFVNRQRVLPGKGQPLKVDDVIQLGGVQLRVGLASAADLSPARPTADVKPVGPFSVVLPFGPTCRTWDDFLAVSAQRWNDLRQELVSGRLAGLLASQHLSAFAPDPNTPGSPDERLDAWLGKLPVSKSASPELAIHPKTISVRASAEGGVAERVVSISNTGYRILRGSLRIEPEDANWITIEPEGARKAFEIVEELPLRLRITSPAVIVEPLTASLVVDSNGGSCRVPIVLDRAGAAVNPLTPATTTASGFGPSDWISGVPASQRLIRSALIFAAFGVILWGIHQVWPEPPDDGSAGLASPAIVMAFLGAIAGGLLGNRRGSLEDVPFTAGAGAVAGVMLATVLVAIDRTIQSIIGGVAGVTGMLLAWTLLGLAFAAISLLLVPYRGGQESKS